VSAHAPGPWFVADWYTDFGGDLTTVVARRPEVLGSGQSSIWPDGVELQKVADTAEGTFDYETTLANARLIAAAPELLGACINLMAVSDGWTREGTIFDGARAAIKKATEAA
jgi:hypothetical protein